MQIIIKDGSCSYTYDSSANDIIEGGWIKQYHPNIDEIMETIVSLLSNCYRREDIEESMRKML